MRASVVLASSLVALLVACSAPVAREFGKPDIDSINQMFQEFVPLQRERRDEVGSLFTPGGVVLPPNASTVRGTENVREYYVRRFARGPRT